MARRRKDNPDQHPPGVVDADRGSGSLGAKQAEYLDQSEHQRRESDRAGLRDLDELTENLPGLNRMQKDRERLFPRDTDAPLGHARMRRTLPQPGQLRVPLSARQRRERSKARRQTQATMPLTQLRAQRDLVTKPNTWTDINGALSQAVGDIQELPEPVQRRIRRVDRAIQAAERRNDRGHVLYANTILPPYINRGNRDGFVANHFQPGDTISFDRYTFTTHQLHETVGLLRDPALGEHRVVVFEIQTRRGAYLGRSQSMDVTHHLLPRAMQFEVIGAHEATYQDPTGATGRRMVIQLRDVTPGAEQTQRQGNRTHDEET